MPDFSVIKIPTENRSYAQACELKRILSDEELRRECLQWLLRNDPRIHAAFRLANYEFAAADESRCALLLLVASGFI